MYTRKRLELKSLKRLKAIAADLAISPSGDKRLKTTWIEAILLHQPQEQPKPEVKPNCGNCPFASHISGDRYLCTASPDLVASGGKVVRAHWDVGTDCRDAITAHQEAEASTEQPPAQEPVPVYSFDGFTVHLVPSLSDNRCWGWEAEVYHPHKRERYPLGSWYGTSQEAILAASKHIQEQAREQIVVKVLTPVVVTFQQLGFSVSEILDGLAEMLYRQGSCSDSVIRCLEDASSAYEKG